MELIFSLGEIESAAKKFISFVEGRKIFAFNGDLGSGKTTFIAALCRQLGVMDNLSSPTYSIIQQYTTTAGQIIYHIDLYRLKDEEEAINAGVEECIYNNQLCFIEWPDKAPSLFPETTVEVFIEGIENDRRKLSVKLPHKVIYNS